MFWDTLGVWWSVKSLLLPRPPLVALPMEAYTGVGVLRYGQDAGTIVQPCDNLRFPPAPKLKCGGHSQWAESPQHCFLIPTRLSTRSAHSCAQPGDKDACKAQDRWDVPIPLRVDGTCQGKLKGTTGKKSTASPAWPGLCGHLQCDSLGTVGHVDINCGPGGDLYHHTIPLKGRWEVLN